MLSINKCLLSLALVVAAFSSQNQHLASANLTPHNIKYDATASYMMASLGDLMEFMSLTRKSELTAKYGPVATQLKEQAAAGTLTAVQFACVVDEIYPLSGIPYMSFEEYATDYLDAAEYPTVDFTEFAAPYYCDFVTAMMSTVAGSIKNTQLSAQVAAFKTQLEKDITNKVSPKTLKDNILAFYEKADKVDDTFSFSGTVGATAEKYVSDLLADLKANKKCGAATPSPAVTTAKPAGPGTGTTTTSPSTTTTMTPTATTATTTNTTSTTNTTTATMTPSTNTTSSTNSTSGPSPTQLPADETIEILSPQTAPLPPTTKKANATTAAPAAKSQASTLVSGAASVLTLAAVFVISSVF